MRGDTGSDVPDQQCFQTTTTEKTVVNSWHQSL